MPKLIDNKNDYEVKMGKYALFFNKNYRYIFIINELLLGVIFVVGSVFFLFDSLKTAGIIIFIIGSLQLFLRPVLKIIHAITIRNTNSTKSEDNYTQHDRRVKK